MSPGGQQRVQDITDVRVVKALAHPIRVSALALLAENVLSPKEIAEQLGIPLPLASYHIRQLERFGLIELVRTAARRGTLQHFYRAKSHPKISDLAWADVPLVVKREVVGAALRQSTSAMAAAAAEGGFDRQDAHASRTAFELDERAWDQLSKLLAKTLERVEQIQAEANDRLRSVPDGDSRRASVVMMLFEGPYASDPQDALEPEHRRRGARRKR